MRDVLRKRIPRAGGLSILDAGCGTGGMLPLLAEFGQVEGLESSPEAAAHAVKRVAGATVHAGELPGGLPAGRNWDLVTAFDVIEHLPNPVAALEAVRGVLREGGRFVCTVPAYTFLWGRHDEMNRHFRRYTERMLRSELEAAGFRVEWSTYFNTLLFPAIALARLAGRLFPRRDAGSDFRALPGPLNRLLEAIMSAERYLAPHNRLPFGVSILAVARPDAPVRRP